MRSWFNHRIRRLGTNRYRVRLPEEEALLIASLIPQMRDLLSTDDPALTRLFPTAYADDPERDAGFRIMTRDELLERRFASLDVLEATLEGGDVTDEELASWLRSLNDLRLVIGTRLDVSEDDDPDDMDPGDPDAAAWTVYHYLGGLLSLVVDALAEDLPPGQDDDPADTDGHTG